MSTSANCVARSHLVFVFIGKVCHLLSRGLEPASQPAGCALVCFVCICVSQETKQAQNVAMIQIFCAYSLEVLAINQIIQCIFSKQASCLWNMQTDYVLLVKACWKPRFHILNQIWHKLGLHNAVNIKPNGLLVSQRN